MLQGNLKFGTLKKRFWGISNSIEEEIELKKQAIKKIDNIERLKTEVKLLQDLNYEKDAEIAEIRRIEIRLKTLRISKTIINAFKKLIIPKE